MEIKRDAYLQQLIERKDNGMIKVITGIRRCGKSFLLFTIFKRYLLENGIGSDHIIEIALDGIENEELRDPKMCFKYIKDAVKDDGKYYLLLDEVQFMPRFEEVLNSLLRMSNIDVYVTGSNSRFLSSDIVTEFRGRGDEIRIYPLSFAEFYSVYDGDYDDAWDDYMIYGGLPQIVSFQSERQKADYLKNIFANVYLKDVIERNKIQNVDEIGILVDVLASAIGAPTNPSKIANTFASQRQMTYTNKTISNHIDYLADAFLISKASRYDIKGGICMKKLIASVLTLVCILTLARCGKSDSGDYPATIMVNGTNYYSTDHAVPVEVDESVIQYTTSYAENGIPQKDGEANFNRDLGTPYAVIEDDRVVVLIDNEWIEFKAK